MSHLGQRLSALIDGELSDHKRERVLAHLARCASCRQEAAALRALKQRMHALGEATANTALTDRLIAVAGVAGPPPWKRRLPLAGRRSMPGAPRRRWPVRSLAVAGLTLAGLGVPAAAFLAGGGQQDPGPRVTPAIDTFMLQHDISTGNELAVPATPSFAKAGQPGAANAPASAPVAAPTASTPASADPAVFSAASVAAALTRVAAAYTRVAGPAGGSGTAGRVHRPHPVTTAGAP